MTWLTKYRKGSTAPRSATAADDHVSYVTLADGRVAAVPHANLAAAKELLAMQKAALRRVEAARSHSRVRDAERGRARDLELVS